MATVAEIWRYPVKSMAGERLDSCEIGETGLIGDRRWALVDGEPNRVGKLLSIRQEAVLMTYRSQLADHAVEVVTPSGERCALDDRLVADLVAKTSRPLTLRDAPGSNFDDSHVLVVNLATVAAFGLAAGAKVDHRRFRANLYLDNLEPEAEVGWLGHRIHAGDAELEVVRRCDRCVVITRDPDTTMTSPELLRVLAETSETNMGVYCRVLRAGRVATGDLCGPD